MPPLLTVPAGKKSSVRGSSSSNLSPRAGPTSSQPNVQRQSTTPRRSTADGAVIESFPPPVPSSLPFEFQYSYSEVPKQAPIKLRNKFSPFGPQTMGRPWTGKAPLSKSKKKIPEFDSFKPPPVKKGVKYVQQPGPFPPGQGPKPAKSREEVLGEPLIKEEIDELVASCLKEQRQLNLGRDGLTHNMLDLIHSHWKRRRCLRIKCKGVPTVDMDNVCFHLEDKTGGAIIHRAGGTVYLYRGRYYNYKDRPFIPLMLWKPLAPFYPKLVKPIPDGLTKEEVTAMRKRGKQIEAVKKLNKNGVYLNLVQEVRDGFLFDDLVKLDCKGLNPSDYKKIGAKLKDLVPCVLLSFEKEQILMWKGRDLEVVETEKHPVADGGAEPDEEDEEEEEVGEGARESAAAAAELDEDDGTDEDDEIGSESDEEVSSRSFADRAVAEAATRLVANEAETASEAAAAADHVFPPSTTSAAENLSTQGRPASQAAAAAANEESNTGVADAPSETVEAERKTRKVSTLDLLWDKAIDAGKAVALDEPELVDPDTLKEMARSLSSMDPVEAARSRGPAASDKAKAAVKKGQKKGKGVDFSSSPKSSAIDELAKFLAPNRNTSAPR